MRGLGAFAPEALAEYERCVAFRHGPRNPSAKTTAPAPALDLDHDRADLAAGQLPCRCACCGVSTVRWANALMCWPCGASGAHAGDRPALPCGHYIAEEAPDLLAEDALSFFDRFHQHSKEHHEQETHRSHRR
jgi:haloacetate dehalogenase